MPNVYVIGGLLPTGGAYMAYHLGLLLHRHFGYALHNVVVYEETSVLFDYPVMPTSLPLAQMEERVRPDDIVIYNPSFSSLLLGLRVPGIKIMYVQDFRTFLLLDCHCDLYVSVSQLVSRYVQALYGLSTPVIPAFIQTASLPPVLPWHERPPGSVLVYMKNPSQEHRLLLEGLTLALPTVDFSQRLEGRALSHQEFLRRIGSVRYLINLSLAEGFGLVPLEAMAMGTMVTGVDGLAGRDYMRSGENCLVSSITDLRDLPAIIHRATQDDALAQRCVEKGLATAAQYGYEQFKRAWLEQMARLLEKEPHA